MNPNKRANETMAAFQRYLSTNDRSEIEVLSLEVLRSADEQYGQRDLNAGFRIALLNRIKEIEEDSQRQHQSKIRALGYVVTFALGVLVTLAVSYLT